MKKAGYLTAMIGKWHLDAEPASFDYYNVLSGQGKYFDPDFIVKGETPWPKSVVKHEGYVSDVITDIGLDWLEKRDRTKPFFLMLHHKAPHDMFEFAPRYADYLKDIEIPEPDNLYNQPAMGFGSVATRGEGDSLVHRIGTSVSKRHPVRNYGIDFDISPGLDDHEYTHQAYQEYLKCYLRCAKSVDDNLARVSDYLKENKLFDNTIIIYTSDQSMMLGEHDYVDKRWMYEESMRTYSEILGAPVPDNAGEDSISFLPTLLGGKITGARGSVIHHSINRSFTLREDKWKLELCAGSGGWRNPKPNSKEEKSLPDTQLYDLSSDISESRNLSSEEPEVVARLTKQLEQIIAEGRSIPGENQANDEEIVVRKIRRKSSESWRRVICSFQNHICLNPGLI